MELPDKKGFKLTLVLSSILLIFLSYFWVIFSINLLGNSTSYFFSIIPTFLLLTIILILVYYLTNFCERKKTKLHISTKFTLSLLFLSLLTYFILTNVFFYSGYSQTVTIIIQVVFNLLIISSYLVLLFSLKLQVINYSEKDYRSYIITKKILEKRNTRFNSLLMWACLLSFANVGIIQSLVEEVFSFKPLFYVLMLFLFVINLINIIYNINNKQQFEYKDKKNLFYIWIIGYSLSLVLTVTFVFLYSLLEKRVFGIILIGVPLIYYFFSLYGEYKLLKYQYTLYDNNETI